ncbi:hypothetical protein [Chromatium okenii]|uniref:hypothetical protein n=1 Tax=Chromatium okenii TaxID=61644 RepID=UPI0011B0A757|nr:hypothetical protein [Chromatium okenii]
MSIRPIRARSKLLRTAKKRGWYHLASYRASGADYITGAYGIWHGADNGKIAITKPESLESTPITHAEREAIAAENAARAAAYEKETACETRPRSSNRPSNLDSRSPGRSRQIS